MGTPGFALPALTALHNSKHEIALVVTQPDRPRGRGQRVFSSPVKENAVDLGYDVFQPESIRSDEFAEKL